MSALLIASLAVSYRIEATLDPDAKQLRGSLEADVRNDGAAAIPALDVWLYPNRFAGPPAELDDASFYWVYPKDFDAGAMRVEDVRVEERPLQPVVMDHERAGRGTLLRIALPTPLAPAARTRLSIRFAVDIPERYGSFGCAAGVCTLAQGWHPMLAPATAHARNDDMPARADYQITVASPWATVLGGEIASSLRLRDAAYVPLVAFRRLHLLQVEHRGVRISYLGRFTPVPESDKRIPYGLENFYRIGTRAARRAIDLLADLGLDLPARLVLCEVPLRNEIAQPHAGMVLVSDRAWRLLPLARFRKFHTFQVARAIYGSVLEDRGRAYEDARDLSWSPDAAASFLVELLTLKEYGRVEFARDVLRYFAFLPAIDSLIYAPKVAFSSAYFGSIEDPDVLRDDLRRFNNELPRGKRLYEKLKDLLGAQGAMDAMRFHLVERQPLRHAAERVAGRALSDFFAQWLSRYPRVHYAIVAVESRKQGRGLEHLVRVEKRGTVVEPVSLWVRDEAGAEISLRWDGRSRTHDFRFSSGHALDVVHLDPKERLIESWPGHHGDLRLGNRQPAQWKFLLYQFQGLVDVITLRPAFLLEFSLRRLYDLSQSIRIALFRTPETDWGAAVGYVRGFGDQIDPNRRSSAAGVTLFTSRLNENFALPPGPNVAQEPSPGTRLGLALGVGHDDRAWLLDPHQGFAAGIGAGTNVTLLDEGSQLWTYVGGASVTKVLRVRQSHLVGSLSASAVDGNVKLASQLIGVGGAGGMIGYQADELFGRGAALLRLEHRHMFVQGLDWNVLHLVRGRGFGGAVFFDAASLASCEELPGGWFGGDSYFFDAGYSLRSYFDTFGVSQALLSADIGVPLNRHDRSCLGVDSNAVDRPPIGFYLSILSGF